MRILAATLGAYLLASLAATGLALLLPMGRTEAVLIATMAAFLIAPGVTIWAFLTRRPRDALGGILLAAGAMAGLIWLGGRGA
ncbi:ketohydroxyglutarate aldolase [Sphingobium olei]